MAENEEIGGIRVTISADATPALEAFGKTATAAKSAGQQIAAGLNTAQTSSNEVTAAIERLGIIIREEGAAAQLSAQRNAALAGSIRTVGTAAHGAGGEIGAMSALVRVAFGEQSIRAVERLGVSVLGLGAAAQTLLPIVGVIALAEMAERVENKMSGAKAATEEFKSAMEATDRAAKELVSTLDTINVDKMRDAFGGAAGERMQATVLGMESMDKISEMAKVRQQIANSQGADWLQKTFGKVEDVDALKQKLEQLSLEARTLAERSDALRNHANTVTAPKEAEDREAKQRELMQAGYEYAKEQQDKQERLEQQGIETAVRAEKEHQRIREQALSELAESGRIQDEELKKQAESQRAAAEEKIRNAEISERVARQARQFQSVSAGSDAEVSRLQIQISYEGQIVHSRQQQVEYAQQLAQVDVDLANQKVAEAKAEVDLVQSMLQQVPTAEQLLKVQQAQTDLAKAEAEAKKATLSAQKSGGSAAKDNPFGNIATAVNNSPNQLADALANGIAKGHIGEEVRGALKGIGKEMMGDVFKDLIAATLGNTLASISNTAATELNTIWLAVKSFLGFADGGRPPLGVPSIVGEHGPELFIPDHMGTIIPNVPTMQALNALPTANYLNSASSSVSVGAIHLHGVQSPQDMARALPSVLKRVSPKFSPSSTAWSAG